MTSLPFLPPDIAVVAGSRAGHRRGAQQTPARYLIRYAEGHPDIADFVRGQVIETLAGLQLLLQALALGAPPRASRRYNKTYVLPFRGATPDLEQTDGELRVDLQAEDADELDLAHEGGANFVPATSAEQSQPASEHDRQVAHHVRALMGTLEQEAVDAFMEGPPAPRAPSREPVPEWTSPAYGSVYVKLGDWTNLGAVVDGKRMRYGWNAAQSRWARGEVPPDALLAEVAEHGWSFWQGAGAPRTEAPAHGGSRSAPAPVQMGQPPEGTQEAEAAPASYKPPGELALTKVASEEVKDGDILVTWEAKGSTAWVQVVHPKVSRLGGMGTMITFKTDTLFASATEGNRRGNRTVHGGGRMEPAPDFTFGNIVYRRAAYDYATQKGRNITGWGSALVRYYLDRLGITYDPRDRFLWMGGSQGSPFFVDITAPAGWVYPGPKPEAAPTGSADIRPEPGDVVISKDGGSYSVDVAGKRRSYMDNEHNGIAYARSHMHEGERVWSPSGSSMLLDRLLTVPAPDFTEGNIRAYGRRLIDKYQRWASEGAARLRAVEPHERGELLDLPSWRGMELAQEVIPELLPALPPGVRVLYKASKGDHFEDVTQGTAAGSLPPVRPPPAHPLSKVVRAAVRPFDAGAYAAKFRKLADGMERTIQDKLDPAIGHQNVTHRRAGIASSMRAEGVALQREQGTLRALADAAEAGTLPESLQGLTAKTEVELLAYPWRRLVKDIEYNREYHHPEKVAVLQVILDQGLIGSYEQAKMPGRWSQWKGERDAVRTKAPRKVAGRTFLKWADDLHYESSAYPPPAVVDAIIELGDKVFSPGAVELAQRARRVYRMGIPDERRWWQVLLDFRPIWEAGRKERRSAAELQRERLREAEREIIGAKIPGFFPTPRGIARRAVEAARIRAGARVLEPSAGKGDMALAIRSLHPDAQIDVVEHAYTLRKFLELHGFNLVAHNFMEYNPGPVYDAVVMNPPFEDGQDAIHVMRAYTMLKPGGRLAAIMSSGPFFRSFKRDQAFRDWLEEVGGQVEDLPEGSFTGAESFRQTGVNTKLVAIERDR